MTKEEEVMKAFMGNLANNNEDPFKPSEEVETIEAPTEKIVEEKVEEKLPYHEDKKLQRYIDRQVEKRAKEFQPTRQEQFTKETSSDNPYQSYAEKLMGNNTDEAKLKSQLLAQTLLEIQQRASNTAYDKFSEESRLAKEEERQSLEALRNGIDTIEENFGVDLSSNSSTAKKTRNEFLGFLEKISPKDANGDIKEYADMESAFETFQSLYKPEKNTQAKEIASRGMSRSSADATNTPTKRITFENVREMMGLEN